MKKTLVAMVMGLVLLGSLAPTPALAKGKGGGHRTGYSSSRSGTHNSAPVAVRGYTRKDGTYVAPHRRSAPDGSKGNNWSHRGNVNPDTGKVGTKD